MHSDSTAAASTMVHEDDLAREGGWRLVRRTPRGDQPARLLMGSAPTARGFEPQKSA